jgi:hypothetical protein
LEDGSVEFGLSTFEDRKLCALASYHSIRSPKRSVKEKITVELPYYINQGNFLAFTRGKMFRHAETPLVEKCFGMPTYKQKLKSYVEITFVQSLSAVFLRGRLRHAATFSRASI